MLDYKVIDVRPYKERMRVGFDLPALAKVMKEVLVSLVGNRNDCFLSTSDWTWGIHEEGISYHIPYKPDFRPGEIIVYITFESIDDCAPIISNQKIPADGTHEQRINVQKVMMKRVWEVYKKKTD